MIVRQDCCVAHLRTHRGIRTFQDNCSNIISVAVRKYPEKKQLRKEGFNFSLGLPGIIYQYREIKAMGT